jgi:hypothetical protein
MGPEWILVKEILIPTGGIVLFEGGGRSVNILQVMEGASSMKPHVSSTICLVYFNKASTAFAG